MTTNRYAVSWCYREGDESVRRALFHHSVKPCVEAARIIAGNSNSFEIEVTDMVSGRPIYWLAPRVGQVLYDERG